MKKLLLLLFISFCALATEKQATYQEDKKNFINSAPISTINYYSAGLSTLKVLGAVGLGGAGIIKLDKSLKFTAVFSLETALGIISARSNPHTASPLTHKTIIGANIITGTCNILMSALISSQPIAYVFFGVNGSIQLVTAIYKYFYYKNDSLQEKE